MRLGFLIIPFAVLLGCAPVKYFTYYEGGHDPLYNMNKVKTIGFIPFGWTSQAKAAGCDELVEKLMYVYARDELQKRGYEVYYIPPEYLERDPDSSKQAYYVKESYGKMPDLTLTVYYWQGLGNKVHVPGQAVGAVNWGNYGGGGYYGKTQGYDVQTYYLVLDYTLWSGSPKYMNKAWQGTIKKGSPKLDLYEKAPYMASVIFWKKFDQ